jgi:uncharacterized delta-60 repeat protein/RHS repeat-associated protein
LEQFDTTYGSPLGATAGALDTSFNSTGKVTTDFSGSSSNDRAAAIALQGDGKIIAAGYSGSDFAVARYNTNGSLDTTFDDSISGGNFDGKLTIDFGSTDAAEAVAVQPDGKIVVAGRAFLTGVSRYGIGLARLTATGGMDSLPGGSGGKVTTDLGVSAEGTALALQTDGKMVVAGFAASSSNDVAIVRYLTTGALDTSFDGDGIATTDFGGASDQAFGLSIRADGKIVAAGKSGSDFAVVRYKVPGGLEQRHYAQQDANYNVSSIADVFGNVIERYEQEPYGTFVVLDADWTLDADGSDFDWRRVHQGLEYDALSGLYYVRHRWLSGVLGRWMSQDPLGYVDGMSLYQAMLSSPHSFIDPTGLAARQVAAWNFDKHKVNDSYLLTDQQGLVRDKYRLNLSFEVPKFNSVVVESDGNWEVQFNEKPKPIDVTIDTNQHGGLAGDRYFLASYAEKENDAAEFGQWKNPEGKEVICKIQKLNIDYTIVLMKSNPLDLNLAAIAQWAIGRNITGDSAEVRKNAQVEGRVTLPKKEPYALLRVRMSVWADGKVEYDRRSQGKTEWLWNNQRRPDTYEWTGKPEGRDGEILKVGQPSWQGVFPATQAAATRPATQPATQP